MHAVHVSKVLADMHSCKHASRCFGTHLQEQHWPETMPVSRYYCSCWHPELCPWQQGWWVLRWRQHDCGPAHVEQTHGCGCCGWQHRS